MNIGGQPGNNRIQWDIDNCIRRTQQTIADVSPHQFSAACKARNIESHEGKDCKGHCSKEEIGPSLSPFCVSPVYNQSHSRICQGVNKLCNQHHCTCGCSRNAKNIRIKNHQVRCHSAENQITSQISDTISNAFSPFSHIFYSSPYFISCMLCASIILLLRSR